MNRGDPPSAAAPSDRAAARGLREAGAGAVPSGGAGACVLDELHGRGHIADIDRHFGRLAAEIDGRGGGEAALAGALVSAWARAGHVCLALREVAGRDWPPDAGTRAAAGAVRLPALEPWIEALAASPAVARPGLEEGCPLFLDRRGRLYLDRFRVAEHETAAGILRLAEAVRPAPDGAEARAVLDRIFPKSDPRNDRPRAAAWAALRHRLCVVSGGPGTGKTTTVAVIVALLVGLGAADPGRVALAAPTGKAAARLQEAVRKELREGRGGRAPLAAEVPAVAAFPAEASTVHRLLVRGGGGPLPVDVLVLDEASMVDLTLMARVLAALPSGARLVLLGDASQLASVQPGSVFADLCQAGRDGSSPLTPCVIELVHNWRFRETGGIGRVAAATVRGDAEAVLAALAVPAEDAGDAADFQSLTDPAAFERLASRLADERFAPALRAARKRAGPPGDGDGGGGDDSAQPFRVLCAHRVGPFGAERFNRLVERRLRALRLAPANDPFYPGRPILVTRNDPRTGLSNGDTGVAVRDTDGRARVWFPELRAADGGPRLVAPARLPPHESFFALTVHRAQGSEYDEAAVVLGPAESRAATRELLYTAVTRARRRVVVHGSEESIAAAVGRVTARASGLRDALVPTGGPGRSAGEEAPPHGV